MTATRTPSNDGPPVSIVIYLTPDGWRHSNLTKRGSLICGQLVGAGPKASDEQARDAAQTLVASMCGDFFGLGVSVRWEAGSQAQSWRGTVLGLDGKPL